MCIGVHVSALEGKAIFKKKRRRGVIQEHNSFQWKNTSKTKMNKDIENLKQISAVREKDDDEESALTNLDFTQEVEGVLPTDEIDGHLNLSQYCVSSDADTDKVDSDGEPPSLASLIGVASGEKRNNEGSGEGEEGPDIKRIKLSGELDGSTDPLGDSEAQDKSKVEEVDSPAKPSDEDMKSKDVGKQLEIIENEEQEQGQDTLQRQIQQPQTERSEEHKTENVTESVIEDKKVSQENSEDKSQDNQGVKENTNNEVVVAVDNTVTQVATKTGPSPSVDEEDEEEVEDVEDVEDMEDTEDLDEEEEEEEEEEEDDKKGKTDDNGDITEKIAINQTKLEEKSELDSEEAATTAAVSTTPTTTSPRIDPEQWRLDALRDITEIEYEFAELRQKLYENRLARLELELQMCLEGSHPELRLYYEKIAAIRDYKLRRTYQKQKYELECIDIETRATRTYIHQNFYKQVNDIQNKLLGETTQRWYEINRERRDMDTTVPDVNYHVPVKLAGKTLSCITGYAGPARQSLPGEPLSEDFAHEGIDFHYSSNPVDKLEVIVDRMRLNNEISDLEGLKKYFHGFPGAPSLNGLRDSEISTDLKLLKQLQQQQQRQQREQQNLQQQLHGKNRV